MTQNAAHSRGFTLIELLVVIAMVCFLAGTSVSVMSTASGSKTVLRGAYDLAGVVEFARSEAVARQTYVWMGVKSADTGLGTGIEVAVVASKDGTGTNVTQGNTMPLGKVIRIPNVALVAWSALKPATQNQFTEAMPESICATRSGNKEGIAFNVGQAGFQGMTLTFTPRGEVLLKGLANSEDGFSAWVDISFRQANGKVVTEKADDASVVIEGATGMARIVCLQ